MIRNLLATTAIATLVATGAYAQTPPPPAADPMPAEQTVPQVIHAEGHLASNLIGTTVYSSSGEDAETIGNVQDIVISPDGQVEGLVVGVGGFLGIGRKDVALEYGVVEWVERDGDLLLVIPTNRESLEGLPDFDSAAFRPQAADAEVGNVTPATADQLGIAAPAGAAATDAPATDTDATTGTDDAAAPATDAPADTTDAPATDAPAAAPAPAPMDAPADDDADADTTDTDATDADTTDGAATDAATDTPNGVVVDRDSLTAVETNTLSADDFIGTTVYGADDENVGSINDVILSQDGNVEAVIIDVGGFLGIGAKSVAVSLDNLNFLSDEDGDNHLYTSMTREQLEAQPEYDEATYVDNSADQLLIVPAQ